MKADKQSSLRKLWPRFLKMVTLPAATLANRSVSRIFTWETWMSMPILLAFIAMTALSLGCESTDSLDAYGREFNSELWKQQTHESGTYIRLQMADGIVASRVLDDKSREQLVEMLGAPMETDYFDEWGMVYWLGPERGTSSLDSEWLVINLDAEGNVADYRVIHD